MWFKNTSDKSYEDLWRRYTLVNDWIKAADLKASFIAIASVAVMGFAIDLNKDLNPLELIVFIIVLISSLMSLFMSLMVNLPILKKHSPGPSLLYYGNIANLESGERFHESLMNQDQSNKYLDLSKQIYENSKISYKKMRLLGYIRWPLIVAGSSLAILASGSIDLLVYLIKQIP